MNNTIGRMACGMVVALTCLIAASARGQDAAVTLNFDEPQTAGISGFRALWDTPVVLDDNGMVLRVENDRFGSGDSAIWAPGRRTAAQAGKAIQFGVWSSTFWPEPKQEPELAGGLVFDAVHRSLLVRFPGTAEKIATQINKGYAIQKVELVLPFRNVDLWAEGYAPPRGMSFLGAHWANTKPRWHAVAWLLRKPWVADTRTGPTFNAYINGVGYWKKYGAQDAEHDRFAQQFGPGEVSSATPQGAMDVTAAVNDTAYGDTLGKRLRAIEEQGFLVRKWELYDVGYWMGGYEWASAIGGRGIQVYTPQLVVTFEKKTDAAKSGPLPRATDIKMLAGQLRAKRSGGAPTAVIPAPAQIAQFVQRFAFKKPDWMPAWQWQRVQELHALGGAHNFPATPEQYGKWLDNMLWQTPRSWSGFDAGERVQEYLLYEEAIPEAVRDHHKLYWWAWLMPDRDIRLMAHGYIGGAQAQEYYKSTNDWRGNFSVYRTYVHHMGTMNFNHWATAGVLLGGHIMGSDKMIAEGRIGLESYPLRTWCWYDGSTQESIDHYYLSHSLTAQKIFADLTPTHLDRMMGQSILAKTVEELTSSYHPNLRRFISQSGRTGIGYLLTIQDGCQYIVHTLSKEGALLDMTKSETPGTPGTPGTAGTPGTPGGMPAFGNQLEPGLVAQQTLNGPWIPEWAAPMLDQKPLPYELTSSYKRWGEFGATPLWRRSYQGVHYGLASQDVSVTDETVPFMAQWRRSDKRVTTSRQIGTLIGRYGINDTNLLDSIFHGTTSRNPNGVVGTQGGATFALQHKNKMVLLTSPYNKLEYPISKVPNEVRSFQTTLGLFNFEVTGGKPGWEIYVDDTRVTQLPFKAKLTQRITIKDGVSYIGLIPVPATDLGRDVEIVIKEGGEPVEMQGGGKLAPTLLIESYNFHSATPLDKATADWARIDKAYGGFVIEMADATEYASFKAFQKHVSEGKLELRWEDPINTVHVVYRSGSDVMECGFRTDYVGNWNIKNPTEGVFPYRRVNGKWPYLPDNMDRDSTLTQQGRSGRLEKNGATLSFLPGKTGYLQTLPATGTYAGYNPFPSEPTHWALTAPGGVRITADGRVGIVRVAVRPAENRLWIDHAFREDKIIDEYATALLAFGLKDNPVVEFNGALIKCERVELDGQTAYVIPLRPAKLTPAELLERYHAAQKMLPGTTNP